MLHGNIGNEPVKIHIYFNFKPEFVMNIIDDCENGRSKERQGNGDSLRKLIFA